MDRGVSARDYHERSSHTPANVRASDFERDFENKPIPYKLYTDRPTVDLPERPEPDAPTLDVVTDEGGRLDAGQPTLADVAALCHYSTGVTKRIDVHGGGERAYRAAACTGALYHVDLYVVCDDLDGLAAGVYHYDPKHDRLDVLRQGDYRGAVAGATGGEPGVASAPVTLVATSTWWRNAWKYRTRTYRHAFWDSGTVLANSLAAARSLDFDARVVSGFADGDVLDLLGIDVDQEAPVALLPVGAGDAPPDPPAVESIDYETEPLSEEPKQYDLIADAYVESMLPDGDAAREWRQDSVAHDGDPIGRPAPEGKRVNLNPVGPDVAASTPLPVTVRRRGSCREYTHDPLSFRKVSTVLDRATRGVPMDVRDPDGPALQYNDCYLLVNAVRDLESGVYRFLPDDGELVRLDAGECREDAGHLALDQALGRDAALSAYFLTDIDAVTDALGDRGYRVAQHEAALTGGRLYLSAYAHRDLGATGLTFYDTEVREFFEPWADGMEPTFLWTLGRPA